jgi:hypothetical protein
MGRVIAGLFAIYAVFSTIYDNPQKCDGNQRGLSAPAPKLFSDRIATELQSQRL